MKLTWEIESKDVCRVKSFLAAHESSPLVQQRIDRNCRSNKPSVREEEFWRQMVAVVQDNNWSELLCRGCYCDLQKSCPEFLMSEDSADSPILKQVTIYTDGAAVPNPGAGGYGVVLRFGNHCKELSGGFRMTTNNRMELMAVIVGLEALKESCRVTLYSDSKYIVNAVTSGAVFRWRANGWTINRSRTKSAKNQDLWERLLTAYERHKVEMTWVQGHAGIDDNERCDALAMAACRGDDLPADSGFDESAVSQVAVAGVAPRKSAPRTKIVAEGQPCRKCGTAVVKRTPKKKALKPNQTYYYEWYLYCPECRAMYMVEEAKRSVTENDSRLW